MKQIIQTALCGVLLLLPLWASGQEGERISRFDSRIEVRADASVLVSETLEVVSTGDQIRHGIYRDFPLAYTDRSGRRYQVSFDVQEVTRDGAAEEHHTERKGNGIRVYLGKADVLVTPGNHTYTIIYTTHRQLGFFPDHDELYWNVTGNGWVFPIDSVTATVKLPGDVQKDAITTTFYTGVPGSTAQNGTVSVGGDRTVQFASTEALAPYEGMTIVVGWPKGVVSPPTAAENFWEGVRANLDFIVGALGLLLVLAYYFWMWHRRGRDPRKGTVIARYAPPRGFSPALLRYIRKMKSDSKAFAAAIINLGVKGALTVSEHKGFLCRTTYTIAKKDGASNFSLSPEEKALLDNFFKTANTFDLKKDNASEVSDIVKSFSDSLQQQSGKTYFAKNIVSIVIGALLSVAVVIATVLAGISVEFYNPSGLHAVFWLFSAVLLLTINVTFAFLMRAYTVEGRKVADEIAGFALFLSVTEKDRLNFHNPPEQTPELFEKFLPYALALGVEHQWAQQFSKVFERLKDRGVSYFPAWYVGASMVDFSSDNFASTLGNTFSGVVAAAATPPGSGSGFSGGSSGGGGGGGGGGGW